MVKRVEGLRSRVRYHLIDSDVSPDIILFPGFMENSVSVSRHAGCLSCLVSIPRDVLAMITDFAEWQCSLIVQLVVHHSVSIHCQSPAFADSLYLFLLNLRVRSRLWT